MKESGAYPNVHHLELFYHVARAGGFSAASRVMPYGVQQPAISSQIRQLEMSIGYPLIERRPFSLTPAGARLFTFVEPFFSGLGGLGERLVDQGPPSLCVASSGHILRDHFPELLGMTARAFPDLRIALRDADQALAEPMLLSREMDLAVVWLEAGPRKNLRQEPLITLHPTLVVPKKAPFRSADHFFKSSDRVSFITPSVEDKLTKFLGRELARRGVRWRSALEAGSLDVVHSCVAEGLGVGISLDIPGMHMPAGVRRVVLRNFPAVRIAALWREPLREPAQMFLAAVRRKVAQLRGARGLD